MQQTVVLAPNGPDLQFEIDDQNFALVPSDVFGASPVLSVAPPRMSTVWAFPLDESSGNFIFGGYEAFMTHLPAFYFHYADHNVRLVTYAVQAVVDPRRRPPPCTMAFYMPFTWSMLLALCFLLKKLMGWDCISSARFDGVELRMPHSNVHHLELDGRPWDERDPLRIIRFFRLPDDAADTDSDDSNDVDLPVDWRDDQRSLPDSSTISTCRLSTCSVRTTSFSTNMPPRSCLLGRSQSTAATLFSLLVPSVSASPRPGAHS